MENVNLQGPIHPFLKTPCWIWEGYKTEQGYGRIKVGHKLMGTHRFAYEYLVTDIPQGLVICHKCDNPPCCNPNHLFPGTTRENMEDCIAKGRHISTKSKSKLINKIEQVDNQWDELKTVLLSEIKPSKLGIEIHTSKLGFVIKPIQYSSYEYCVQFNKVDTPIKLLKQINHLSVKKWMRGVEIQFFIQTVINYFSWKSSFR